TLAGEIAVQCLMIVADAHFLVLGQGNLVGYAGFQSPLHGLKVIDVLLQHETEESKFRNVAEPLVVIEIDCSPGRRALTRKWQENRCVPDAFVRRFPRAETIKQRSAKRRPGKEIREHEILDRIKRITCRLTREVQAHALGIDLPAEASGGLTRRLPGHLLGVGRTDHFRRKSLEELLDYLVVGRLRDLQMGRWA